MYLGKYDSKILKQKELPIVKNKMDAHNMEMWLDRTFTTSVEYKHFDKNCNRDNTVVVFETPKSAKKNDIPYYPVNNIENNNRYNKYNEIKNNIVFGGRVGTYSYNDMDKTIENSLILSNKEILSHSQLST